ncbi:MAG: FAD binding domain-containing protein [Candidatus Binatia bacterium]
MMRASWIIPKTMNEAVSAMEEHPSEALLYAGGTYVHEQRERGLLPDIKAVVDLQGLGLDTVEDAGDSFKAGAMVTLNEVIGSDAFRAAGFEALVQAAYATGPDQIKNAATLGGAVACGVPIIDIVPALMSLRVKAVVQDARESRTIDVGDLLNRPEKSLLGKTALIAGFVVPRPAPGSRSQFKKFRRSASDWALVNASASIRMDGAGRCVDAKLAVGARADGYFSLARTEQFLIGKQIDGKALAALPGIVSPELTLADHFTASADYKRSLCGFLLRDAIAGAAKIDVLQAKD